MLTMIHKDISLKLIRCLTEVLLEIVFHFGIFVREYHPYATDHFQLNILLPEDQEIVLTSLLLFKADSMNSFPLKMVSSPYIFL